MIEYRAKFDNGKLVEIEILPNKQDDFQPSPEQVENDRQIALATEIVVEALNNLKIPRLTDESEFPNPRWNVFFQGENKELVLTIKFEPPIVAGWLHVGLVGTVLAFFKEVTTVLSNPKGAKYFISDESDYESAIYDTTSRFAENYISYLPMVVFHSFNQSVNETIISQVKKIIEPELREHWQKLNLPKDFSLVFNGRLKKLTGFFTNV